MGYENEKGLYFVAKFNGKHVIGEAKFLTDFGGHQNTQFNDAMAIFTSNANAVKVAILDGVLYIPSNNRSSMNINTGDNIISALVLRDFLYQV